MTEQIQRGLEELGVKKFSDDLIGTMEVFLENLLLKNKVMNLTAITDPKEVVALHLLDSMTLIKFIPENTTSLIDIGSGAGFPGMPLKMFYPQMEVTLMDALEKRLFWLSQVAEELSLEGLQTLHGRGEELSHFPEYREQYQVATARAVADLRILAEISLPFVEVGGKFLAMKSVDSDAEIIQATSTIETLGGKVTEWQDVKLPETDVTHRIIVIDKVNPSPPLYPRRWAKIKKSPIS